MLYRLKELALCITIVYSLFSCKITSYCFFSQKTFSFRKKESIKYSCIQSKCQLLLLSQTGRRQRLVVSSLPIHFFLNRLSTYRIYHRFPARHRSWIKYVRNEHITVSFLQTFCYTAGPQLGPLLPG